MSTSFFFLSWWCFFGCFFFAGVASVGVEGNFPLALWLTWCGLRNRSWLVWPAGYLAVQFGGQAAGEPGWKLIWSHERFELHCYLVEDVWLFVAVLIRPKRAGDFLHPNTRLNLSLNLKERGCWLVYWWLHDDANTPGGHCVVEDGVDSRVDIEHQAAEVEDVEVHFYVDMVQDFVRGDHHPHCQHFEREETGKEKHDHCAQHDHYLASPTCYCSWLRALALASTVTRQWT